jgi:hypothetical protein
VRVKVGCNYFGYGFLGHGFPLLVVLNAKNVDRLVEGIELHVVVLAPNPRSPGDLVGHGVRASVRKAELAEI